LDKWVGAAGICINKNKQLLMVLQGRPEEEKRWSVPSGGQELEETLEDCCLREVFEETGYRSQVIRKIKEKTGSYGSMKYQVTYYELKILEGNPTVQDPDGLIYEVAWKTVDQIKELKLSFPEDKEFLLNYMK
jgi:8-oxo-dGTP diphosphatase